MLTIGQLKRIREMCKAGVSAAETARRIGCSEAAVRYWQKKDGLRFRKRGEVIEARAREAEAALQQTMRELNHALQGRTADAAIGGVPDT